jgi:iron complex outermembrane receptor protein
MLVSTLAVAPSAVHATVPSIEELKHLSIEDLLDIEITSVSKRAEPLSKAAASVFVITRDDIRRSGAVNLPEALRLAPNLVVQHADSGQYAITARGFNDYSATNRTSNKLLVLIDGRSVYTVLHGGVFWHEHQVMLDDIERIEVISGPGGTLWGANAVNGVINVITRNSKDTQDGLANVRYGTLDRTASVRYGAKIGDNATLRVYGQGYDYGPNRSPSGGSFHDGFHGVQTGFRSDMDGGGDTATVQGDIYRSPIDADGQLNGGNLLGRLTHSLEKGSVVEVQGYFDRAERTAPGVADSSDTYDLQVQHTFSPASAHEVIWGGGHRVYDNEFLNTSNAFVFDDPKEVTHLSNVFAQDTIDILDDLKLTLGTKLEYSKMGGFDYLPSARLAWEVTDSTLLWAAVSRSVRRPTRLERELVAPGIILAASDYASETVVSYEVGYRGLPLPATNLSVSLYYNQYDDLRSIERVGSGSLPVIQANRLEGNTYGVESWGDRQILPWWRLSAGVNVFFKDIRADDEGSTDLTRQSAGNDPSYTYSLRSRMDLIHDIDFDVGLRKVDALQTPRVDSYLGLDARLAKRVADNLEVSLSGFNLLDSQHQESAVTSTATPLEVRRSVIAGLRWTF